MEVSHLGHLHFGIIPLGEKFKRQERVQESWRFLLLANPFKSLVT